MPQLSLRSLLRSLPFLFPAWALSFASELPAQAPGATGDPAASWRMYIGTYTRGEEGGRPASEGIYVTRFDASKGTFGEVQLAARTRDPSFVAIHPSGKYLYCVGESGNFGGRGEGVVQAFAIDPQSGLLKMLNEQTAGGAGPCHLVVDKTGSAVLVANYSGGSVESIRLEKDGRLGPVASFHQHKDPAGQKEPRGHSVNLDAANRFAYVADLGLDQVLIYGFDATTGKLADSPAHATLDPKDGPRHFTFHPSGKYAYVINETSKTVTAFACDPATGRLTNLQKISTLPPGVDPPGGSTAEIVMHPSGRFVYGSNRGHDSIAVYRIHQDSGRLDQVEVEPIGGRTPRNFAIDPSGQFLLAEGQDSDSITVFRIHPESGALEPTGTKLQVPSPVCIRFLNPPQPAGR